MRATPTLRPSDAALDVEFTRLSPTRSCGGARDSFTASDEDAFVTR